MDRTPVNSSNLASVGYESASLTLEIEFRNGGTYRYFDVAESEYQNLLQAGSKGKYFNAYIKLRYRYVKL